MVGSFGAYYFGPVELVTYGKSSWLKLSEETQQGMKKSRDMATAKNSNTKLLAHYLPHSYLVIWRGEGRYKRATFVAVDHPRR